MACQSLLLISLTNYYNKHPDEKEILSTIIEGKSSLSLRILDWFVTHYARTNDILYWIDESSNTMVEKYPEVANINLKKFHLYFKYRAELQSYTKMYFDPFRRHERITFILQADPLKSIETTVGQLNFFRWALQNHVLTYIQKHIAEIEEHMASYQKEIKKGIKKKEVCPSVVNTVYRAPCYIHFD